MSLFFDFRYCVPPYPDYCQQVAIKLTDGSWALPNPLALQQASAGNVYAAWHYWRAAVDSKKQARAFVAAHQTMTPDAFQVLDCEDALAPTKGTTPERIRVCLQEIEDYSGKPAMVYTRASWWNYKVGLTTWAKDHKLWVAHYLASAPRIPYGWLSYRAWQFMGDVYYPGFRYFDGKAGKVDVNVLT